MSPHTISISDKPAIAYQPSLVSDKIIKMVPHNNNYFRPRVPTNIVSDLPVPFITALAHEVRNPLTNINLALELLESALEDSDQQMYLDIIRRSSTRIDVLICDLLKHQPALIVQAEKHSIHQLLDEVLEMTQDRIKLKNVSVRKEYANNDLIIALNRTHLLIGLTNIIVNAIDAMTVGMGVLKVITKSIGEIYILQIEDNGCGIRKENLKHIFKPYFTRKPGGLGLGLATTYETLRSNHIGVSVESQEGEGTCFTLSFGERLL